MSSAYPCLVADIGGTNARFGWVEAAGESARLVRQFQVPEFPSPIHAAQEYLRGLAGELGGRYRAPRRAAFAVATPVGGDRVEMTNSDWSFSCRKTQDDLALDDFVVLNDFEALAFSLPKLQAAQVRSHGLVIPSSDGTMAVVGPGTGLGVASVVPSGPQSWVVVPGEGGHATISAADDFESELLLVVRRKFLHVSAERLLSGIGLPILHSAVATVRGRRVEALSSEAIVEDAVAGADADATATVDAFCALLGSFCGNVALIQGAKGGVYVGGGIVPRFADVFFASRFRERFEAKGRFRTYLEQIPTALIIDTMAALDGAVAASDRRVGRLTTKAPATLV